ncbi:hypothetical protein [Micromonospora tulbaghiae]|nr:hypothetical protein [Micromonospora tulbaghiae]
MARFLADAAARTVPVDLGIAAGDPRERFAGYERTLARPTKELRGMLDSADPDSSALVYAGSFTTATTVCGRRVIGARSPNHLDAERKDRQREVLGLGGRVVCLADGLAHVNTPAVVQGIPDQGIAMATSHTYLVPPSADSRRVRALAETLKRDCTRAVLTPFNPGVPCTFYGFITATSIIDFGPVEALVCWDPRTWRIHAPGILRPLPVPEGVLTSARAEVRAIARRLRRHHRYVGAFGTDGVITDAGYTIHEINPRICAGFGLLDQMAPEAAPLAAVDLVLRQLPNASAVLTEPLAALATALQRHPTPTYRLWETPGHSSPAPADEAARPTWAQQIREAAARGRLFSNELKEGDLWK